MIICKLSTRLTTFASTHFFLATFVFLRVKTASASERVRKPTCSSSNIFRILFLRLFLFLFFHTSNHCPFPQTSEITRVVLSVRQSREFFSSSLFRIDYNTYKLQSDILECYFARTTRREMRVIILKFIGSHFLELRVAYLCERVSAVAAAASDYASITT